MNEPIEVEIRVAGQTVSKILAESYEGTQTRDGITFSAVQWWPSIQLPPNPLLADGPPLIGGIDFQLAYVCEHCRLVGGGHTRDCITNLPAQLNGED